MRRRQGCLEGFFELFMLSTIFDWLQDNVGFGRGPLGCGCGCLLMVIFLFLACGIIFSTDWFRFTSMVWTSIF